MSPKRTRPIDPENFAPENHLVTTEVLEQINGPVGALMLNFSFAEAQVDAMMTELGISTDRPMAFPDMVDAVIRNAPSAERFQPHIAGITSMLRRLKGIAKARNRFAHWRIAEYREKPTPALRFMKVRYQRDGSLVEFKEHWYTIVEIVRMSDDLLEIVADLWDPILLIIAQD